MKLVAVPAALGCVALLLSACGGSAGSGYYAPSKMERDIGEARNKYMWTHRLTEAFSAADPVDCASDDMKQAQQNVDLIEARSASYFNVVSSPNRYSNVQRQEYSEALGELDAMALAAQFAVADAYLEGGCLDQADSIYRHVLDYYAGSSFTSARERARVGIDDVRDKRG